MTGLFAGTATFGAGRAQRDHPHRRRQSDIFVAKYDRDGALLWATQAGGISSDERPRHRDHRARRQLRDRVFPGTATFGPGEPNETTLTASGGNDIFVAKYDRDGALLWATQAGGTSSTKASASRPPRAATATSPGVSVARRPSARANPTRPPSPPRARIRYLRCQVRPRRRASLGHPSRRHRPSTKAAASRPPSAATATSPGVSQGTATFGPGEPNETTLTAAGYRDIFVAKYDRDGALLWATQAGGTDIDQGTRHRDHPARRQLRDRGFLKARRPSARASPTRPPSPRRRERYLRCQVLTLPLSEHRLTTGIAAQSGASRRCTKHHMAGRPRRKRCRKRRTPRRAHRTL